MVPARINTAHLIRPRRQPPRHIRAQHTVLRLRVQAFEEDKVVSVEDVSRGKGLDRLDRDVGVAVDVSGTGGIEGAGGGVVGAVGVGEEAEARQNETKRVMRSRLCACVIHVMLTHGTMDAGMLSMLGSKSCS